MQMQTKVIEGDQKDRKSSSKCETATDELQYLMNFNQSICLAMAKTMQHLSDFVFISMVNFTLTRRDASMNHLQSGMKQDALNGLRTAPLNMATLFPDSVLKRAEDDITNFESKGYSSSFHKKGHCYPYERTEVVQGYRLTSMEEYQPWTQERSGKVFQLLLLTGQRSVVI